MEETTDDQDWYITLVEEASHPKSIDIQAHEEEF